MKLLTILRDEGRGQDMQAVVEQIPYARFLGISVDRKGNEITTILPFTLDLVGNTTLPARIATLLVTAAIAALVTEGFG